MKSNYTILTIESLIMALGIVAMILLPPGHSNDILNSCLDFSQKVADLNLALVIAAIIPLTTNGKIQIKGRQLKKITKESWGVILLNSLAIAISGFFGVYCTIITAAGFLGNLIKLGDLYKNILQII